MESVIFDALSDESEGNATLGMKFTDLPRLFHS